ncbi:basic salivary proline-rich protein 1-like isoform X1 [Lagopus muta]|uniref:basic salivary proline-rich protein 1-like isoform X1 n=1 Tax=Lagopus muta TaxID=64668 RepID=UPI0020A1F11B|nr:basic salivary proline-rich protein 1-like isoform X1 [Lagopus muta]
MGGPKLSSAIPKGCSRIRCVELGPWAAPHKSSTALFPSLHPQKSKPQRDVVPPRSPRGQPQGHWASKVPLKAPYHTVGSLLKALRAQGLQGPPMGVPRVPKVPRKGTTRSLERCHIPSISKGHHGAQPSSPKSPQSHHIPKVPRASKVPQWAPPRSPRSPRRHWDPKVSWGDPTSPTFPRTPRSPAQLSKVPQKPPYPQDPPKAPRPQGPHCPIMVSPRRHWDPKVPWGDPIIPERHHSPSQLSKVPQKQPHPHGVPRVPHWGSQGLQKGTGTPRSPRETPHPQGPQGFQGFPVGVPRVSKKALGPQGPLGRRHIPNIPKGHHGPQPSSPKSPQSHHIPMGCPGSPGSPTGVPRVSKKALGPQGPLGRHHIPSIPRQTPCSLPALQSPPKATTSPRSPGPPRFPSGSPQGPQKGTGTPRSPGETP